MKRMLVVALLAAVALGAAPPVCAASTGEAAPALALPNASGETLVLEAMSGKVVWVDFWASWCGPCKRSFPWMNDMQRKYAAAGFSIVAVNVDKKRQDAERFLAVAPAQFSIVYDPAGKSAADWQIKSMPSSYLIDRNGKVAFVETGFRDERKGEIERRIRVALGLQ